VPWALPAFTALVDSCELYNSSAAIHVSAQAFDDVRPTVLLNPMTSIFVALAFAYMPSFFIATVVKEKSQAKTMHQLLVSGLDKRTLWLSYLLADGAFLCVAFLCPVFAAVVWLDVPYLHPGSNLAVFAMVCLVATASTLVTAYWISGWFKTPENAVGLVLTLSGALSEFKRPHRLP
jgi:hypothetical protein